MIDALAPTNEQARGENGSETTNHAGARRPLGAGVGHAYGLGAGRAGCKGVREDAQLAVAWTKWAYSKPEAESPLIGSYEGGDKCDGRPVSPTPGKKKTWFLAGTPDGSVVERTCTVPVGRRLFFPLVSATFFITEPGETKEQARQFVKGFIREVLKDPDLSIEVTVDGKEVKSKRIDRARTRFFNVTFPKDNIFAEFGVERGKYETITNGLWVLLPPLSKGEHTIHGEVSAPNVGTEGFSQNNTYHLTVVNRKSAP
jgi:hypothetical protein